MQFKVPQNLDLADKIVGPLTLFQLLYLLVGFLIVYSLLKSGSTLLFVLIGIPVAIITLAMAFIKINDQPFSKFIFSLILFAIRPKTRIWHKGSGVPNVKITKLSTPKTTKVAAKPFDIRRAEKIAQKLDKP